MSKYISLEGLSAFLAKLKESQGSSTPSFGGLVLSPGAVYWDDMACEVYMDSDWYFSETYQGRPADAGWDTHFFSFETARDNILGNTFDGGWRIPSENEWKTILGLDENPRAGATVNGESGAHWLYVNVDISNESFNMFGKSSIDGLIIFPDNVTITRTWIDTSCINDNPMGSASEYGLSVEEIGSLISEGCAFLPVLGYWWDEGGGMFIGEEEYMMYMASEWMVDSGSGASTVYMDMSMDEAPSIYTVNEYEDYIAVRLVRDA